ncbi:hypothetical protein ACHAWF_005589 [Thalassiosira exigua]
MSRRCAWPGTPFHRAIGIIGALVLCDVRRLLVFVLDPAIFSERPNSTTIVSDSGLNTATIGSIEADERANFSFSARAAWFERERYDQRAKISRSREIIPIWMSEYFAWHQEQREKVGNNTGDDVKYLVVRCLQGEKCGGLSDRMKPMPFYLMVANLTRRVMLIHWEKPCELEHFLLPPTNGLDWRVEGTNVTIDDIRNNDNFHNGHGNGLSGVVRTLMGVLPGGKHFVQAKVLNMVLDGGTYITNARDLFNRWRKEANQRPAHPDAYLGWNKGVSVNDHDLFEDVFRLLFEPTPRLHDAIYDQMSDLDILNGEFAAAQVRAKNPKLIPDDIAVEWAQKSDSRQFDAYQAKQHLDMAEEVAYTEKVNLFLMQSFSNAVECADQMAPGLPIYLASDSGFGKYMQNISDYDIRVAAWDMDTDPPHIDSNANQGRDPSDFFLPFADVFIMARAKCLSHSGTGFGMFPLRMSGNSCVLVHTKTQCPKIKSNNQHTG